jgi:hypothetical protein
MISEAQAQQAAWAALEAKETAYAEEQARAHQRMLDEAAARVDHFKNNIQGSSRVTFKDGQATQESLGVRSVIAIDVDTLPLQLNGFGMSGAQGREYVAKGYISQAQYDSAVEAAGRQRDPDFRFKDGQVSFRGMPGKR